MRWLFGVLLVLGAIAAGIFAAGYYLLPATSQVSGKVEIGRPAAVIYPLLANLKTFNEYSPWFDRDPKALYVYEGAPEGTGQIARWDSSVSDLGQGSMTIIKTLEDREVDTRVVFGGSPIPFAPPMRALSKFTLTEAPRGGTVVNWTLSASCSREPLAAPCRIVNFVALIGTRQQFASSLGKLKQLGESLPALDFSDLKPERAILDQVDFAYVESEPPQGAEQFRAALRKNFASVDAFLKQNALQPTSAPLAYTVKSQDGQRLLRVGRPFAGPLPVGPSGGDVQIGKTPGGLVLKLLYVGDYTKMTPTYAKLDAYARAHRLEARGYPWEVYVDDPDKVAASDLRTDIYFPIQ